MLSSLFFHIAFSNYSSWITLKIIYTFVTGD
jgi:hypothetical protein